MRHTQFNSLVGCVSPSLAAVLMICTNVTQLGMCTKLPSGIGCRKTFIINSLVLPNSVGVEIDVFQN